MITKSIAATPLDYYAELSKLSRYDVETIPNFVRRVGRQYSNTSSPNGTYLGQLWALNNDAGLDLVPYVEIDSTIPSSTIVVTQAGITLSNSVETISYDFWITDASGNLGPVEGFDGFLNAVTGSTTFTLSVLNQPVMRNELFTIPLNPVNIVRVSNIGLRDSFELPSDRTYIELPDSNIVCGSITFSDMDGDFVSEVASENDITFPGEYCIDYVSGYIECYDRMQQFRSSQNPNWALFDLYSDYERAMMQMSEWYNLMNGRTYEESVSVSYQYIQLPFRLILAPIQLFNWVDRTADKYWFNSEGDIAALPRTALPVIESIIDEVRSNNASY